VDKFNYPELQTENHDGMRFYAIPNGSFYPSITTVLAGTQPEEAKAALAGWRNSLGAVKADAASKKATDHGTNVHLLAERYLKKQNVQAPINGAAVPQPDLAAFNALKLKLDKIDEVWGQECALYSPSLEVAGRCDLVGKYKGIPVIVDFKTAGRVKGHKDIGDYKLQLAFYACAHNEMFGTNIRDGVILMVAQTGFPMEFNVKLDDYMDELKSRVGTFWSNLINRS